MGRPVRRCRLTPRRSPARDVPVVGRKPMRQRTTQTKGGGRAAKFQLTRRRNRIIMRSSPYAVALAAHTGQRPAAECGCCRPIDPIGAFPVPFADGVSDRQLQPAAAQERRFAFFGVMMKGIYIAGGWPQIVIDSQSEFWDLPDQEKLSLLIQMRSNARGTIALMEYAAEAFTVDPETNWIGPKKVVYRRDGPYCRYCGQECSADLTIDHIIPSSSGGPDTLENMVIACRSCNSKKGARTPEEANMILHPLNGRHP